MAKGAIRVFLVDDYEPFRRFVASTLERQPELHIIGEAADGLEAVRKAEELQPDLILLDIGLSTLNGIEAARRIQERSPKSTILFISENRSSDIVKEALHTGAGGYVVKSRAGSELLPAVEAVLQGKKFVSSSLSGYPINRDADVHTANNASPENVAPLPAHKGEIVGRHEALLYSDDRQLLEGLLQFIGTALKSGNAAAIVATHPHRETLVRKLQASGVDIAAAIEQGRYVAFDAGDTISTFLVDGMLEPVRFLQCFGKVILKAANAAKGEHSRVAVFGECADLLWKHGNAEAAIQDEKLCNQLIRRYDVDILCGCSLDSFQGGMGSYAFEKICAEHSAVHSR